MTDFMVIFQTVFFAMLEIFILGACGFIMVRKKFLNGKELEFLTKLAVEFLLPLFIFTKILKSFSFAIFPNWWLYTLIGLAINLGGFLIGYCWVSLFKIAKSNSEKRQFISLVGFQNSGYIPLILAATLLSTYDAEQMYIYIFLLLLGFNLVIWSFGVWFLSSRHIKHFELASIFSPPVVATILSMLLIGLGIEKKVPDFIYHPAKMLGDCLLPLAMIIIGGNLALVSLRNIDAKAIANISILKLIILPILTLVIFWYMKPVYLTGLFIILQVAVPSATTLSLISRHYQLEDKLISHGIFFTHLFCILTIPLWLIVYEMLAFSR